MGWLGAALGCEPDPPVAARTAADEGTAQEPRFVSPEHRTVFARGDAQMAGIDALRGTTVTPAFVTDLGFKCAGLRQIRVALAAEPDPVVARLVRRIDKTCSFDVPLASASFEVARIEKKRVDDPTASVKSECASLHLAIADVGTPYLENPKVSALIEKEASYCQGGDSVRVVRP